VSDLVPTEDIERIVGIARHRKVHYGRAVSAEETVYILHSRACLDSGIDLRDCRFSVALDEGINMEAWLDMQDVPVALGVWDGRLIPLRGTEVGSTA
jgi:hypothetical protein